jgi:hypothetical protein
MGENNKAEGKRQKAKIIYKLLRKKLLYVSFSEPGRFSQQDPQDHDS